MLQGHDIICIASTYWDALWLSAHQYMHRLAQHNRVLFIERPVSPMSFLTAGQWPHMRRHFDQWRSGAVRQVEAGLYVAAPPPAMPPRFEQPMIAVNQRVRGKWVRRVAQQLGFENPLLWIYDPDAALMVGHMGEKLALYAITDDHPTRAIRLNREISMRKWERRLVQACDVVIASAANLAEMKLPDNPNTHYVPHGVDCTHFAQALEGSYPAATELAEFPKPIVGFIGQINYRMNVRVMRAAAESHPEWSFVFIGPMSERKSGSVDRSGADSELTELRSRPNVHFLGPRPRDALPAYLKAMSACVVPFVIDEHTTYMHPLKTLEYLAAGKPVVATPLPALQIYQDYVTLTEDPAAFVAALETAIATDTPERQQQRSLYAATHSWENRLEYISSLIEQRLSPIN